jgi:D-arabinose 1-dehydrogenase-like Zn-dependent alcohol dehydrogenase
MDLHPKGSVVTMGHEGVGIIDKIHPSVEGKGFKVGDHVGCGYFIGCCFECEGCLTHNMLCETNKQLLQGGTADGFFAEYAVEDWQNLVILPDHMDLTKCAPIFCAGITGMFQISKQPITPTNSHSFPRC